MVFHEQLKLVFMRISQELASELRFQSYRFGMCLGAIYNTRTVRKPCCVQKHMHHCSSMLIFSETPSQPIQYSQVKSRSESRRSPKPEQHQATESNEAPQDNPIPPLLRPNPLHQPVNPRYLGRSSSNPPLDATQTLPL